MKCYLWYIKNKGTKINFKDLESEDSKTRFGALDNIYRNAQKDPKKVYPHLNEIIKLLNHENKIFKWRAIDTIGEISRADEKNKLDKTISKIIALLKSGELITAHHVIDALAIIALSKPKLQPKITRELVKISKYKYPTETCNQYARGRAVLALSKYIDNLSGSNRKLAVKFIESQKNNKIASTRKRTEILLRKGKI